MTGSHKVTVWSEYWRLLKPYLPLAILTLFLVIIREGKGVFDRYLVSVLVDAGTSYVGGDITQTSFLATAAFIAFAFAIATVILVISRYAQTVCIVALEEAMGQKLKEDYFKHIVKLDHNFHAGNKSGSLIARMARAGGALDSITDTMMYNFAPLAVIVILSTGALWSLAPLYAMIIFGMVAVYLGYSFVVQRRMTHTRDVLNAADDDEKAGIADTFTNIEAVKYFGKEEHMMARHHHRTERTKRASIRHWRFFSYMDTGQTFIIGLSLVALMWFSTQQFLAHTISIGQLTFVYTTYVGIAGALSSFMNGIRNVSRGTQDLETLVHYRRAKSAVTDLPDAKPLFVKRGDIRFENVTFRYRKRAILKDFTLHITSGEKVAFVGSSGAGKSTTVKLLYRFYDVESGRILVDGRDIRTAPQEQYRSQLAIVPQEGVLFDDTIYNNIAFSRHDATRTQVHRAIAFAQLDKTIHNLPDGEDTIVGERGIKLSGGERQRVSIARAILADTKILVLDEATSSLDSETENEIQRDLAELLKGRTAIIIAHRLSTIMRADRIIVLDHGEIVQEGTHAALMKKPGRYRKLWELQKGGYIGE